MHRQRIAHRDLKPENILLTTEDPPRVKIADFGLSTAVGEAALLKVCLCWIFTFPKLVANNHF